MEFRRITAEQAGFKASADSAVSHSNLKGSAQEVDSEAPTFRIFENKDIPLGELNIYPVVPGFERPDPFSSEDTFERLPIPLSEGRTYVVVNGARPIVRDGDDYFESASDAAEARTVLNKAEGDYKTAKGEFDQRTKDHWGLVGVDMPEIGKTVTSRPVYTRQVTDPKLFREELGVKFQDVANLALGARFRIREGQVTKTGKKVTPELIEKELRRALSRLGIDLGEQGLEATFEQIVTDVNWDTVIDELHAGRLSFGAVSATPVQRLDSRTFNPSRGTKKQ